MLYSKETDIKTITFKFGMFYVNTDSQSKNKTEMKTLRSKFSLLTAILAFLFISAGQFTFAQQTPTNTDQKPMNESTSVDSRDKMQKDHEKRMSQFTQMYTNLKNRSENTNDPQLKADLESLQSKMERIRADMKNYLDTKSSMSEEQMNRAKTNLKAQLSSLKRDYKKLKREYGKSDAGNTSNNNQTAPK